MSKRRSPDGGRRADRAGSRAWWRVFQVAVLVGWLWSGWQVVMRAGYRIDIDVYRMGGRAWLAGVPLYGGTTFPTPLGLDLPFTYPPLAAVLFAPFAWLSLPAASAAITVVTLALLVVSTAVVLTRLDVWPASEAAPGPAWRRRAWLAAALVLPAMWLLEPVRSNLEFGQINAVLMTLVVLDCVPRRTPWPRGLLVGLAMALKLTPAVFLLYFLLRRDGRAVLGAVAGAAAGVVAGFAAAWSDSWTYWTETVHHTGRIGSAALNTNQNLAGALARLGLPDGVRSALWVLACVGALALTSWAAQRLLRARHEPAAVSCVALLGLLVSPVSWSHHWVWVLPALLVLGVTAWRAHHRTLLTLTLAGAALFVVEPLQLLPKNGEVGADWWRQLVGISYVWWALAVIAVAGAMAAAGDRADTDARDAELAVPAR